MPLYTYRCPDCGAENYSTTRGDRLKESCRLCRSTGPHRRVFGFSHHPGFEEGYNRAVGAYVSSAADFRSKLSKASDEASANTGMEHRFVPIDLRDPAHKPPEHD